MEDREAAGESFWTETLPPEAIRKIAQAIEDAEATARGDTFLFHDLVLRVRDTVTRDTGAPNLPASPERLVAVNDTGVALSYVEATYKVLREQYQSEPLAEEFAETVNTALLAHRVRYRFIPEDGQIVPLDSQELHSAVVEPALVLLRGKRDFADAHESYLNALKELSESEPANAITDAGTAFQQTLEALGCEGNSLGPLIKSAKSKGLLARHDAQLEAGIKSFMDWVSADRSEKGDSHKPGSKELGDAWLMVHVVGALIVRLAGESSR